MFGYEQDLLTILKTMGAGKVSSFVAWRSKMTSPGVVSAMCRNQVWVTITSLTGGVLSRVWQLFLSSPVNFSLQALDLARAWCSNTPWHIDSFGGGSMHAQQALLNKWSLLSSLFLRRNTSGAPRGLRWAAGVVSVRMTVPLL